MDADAYWGGKTETHGVDAHAFFELSGPAEADSHSTVTPGDGLENHGTGGRGR